MSFKSGSITAIVDGIRYRLKRHNSKKRNYVKIHTQNSLCETSSENRKCLSLQYDCPEPIKPRAKFSVTQNKKEVDTYRYKLKSFWNPAYYGDTTDDINKILQGKTGVYIICDDKEKDDEMHIYYVLENKTEDLKITIMDEEYVIVYNDKEITGKLINELIENCYKEHLQLGEPLVRTKHLLTRKEDLERFAKSKLISLSEVDLRDVLGKGNFAEVRLGLYQETEVAVKKLLQSSKKALVGGMEIAVMLELKHGNVIEMLSWALDDDALYIITELASGGTLKEYLKELKEDSINAMELEGFTKDIAKGMCYLESIPLFHRDLAARNIFLNEYKTAKIGDFGLSFIDDKRYVVNQFALKWSAIEVVRSRENFNIKSDVWSFGIILWEIYTHGELPFVAIDSDHLLEELENGGRPEIPQGTPVHMWDIMRKCWIKEPEQRPSFYDIQYLLDRKMPKTRTETRTSTF